jgi:uncharacterized protein YhjY with autotransporter beta-barrel domain
LAAANAARAQTTPLPASYDLRNLDGHSYIGPVHEQGNAGACYAFAAIAAAESTYNRATGHFDAAAADFSESFIAWSLDPKYDGIWGAYGSNQYYDELQGLVDFGVPSEAAFPYVDADPGVQNHHWDAPRVKFSSWHRLPAYDVETMKRALSTFGAIDAGILVGEPLGDYKGGVYNDDNHAATNVVDNNSDGNHRVAIVGWQDSPPEGGDGAWIARNSWSDTWGESGYIRMDYHAARISLMAAYLVYGGWTGEDFHTRLTQDVVAGTTRAAGNTTGYGFYAWGGNNASLVNEAAVIAWADHDSDDVLTHGLFLWGGDHASLDNTGDVVSLAFSKDGTATAYGLCLQGRTLSNSGNVTAAAVNTGAQRATAYGVRYFSFDRTGTFVNSGLVAAVGVGEAGGWAIGAQVDDAAHVINSGTIEVSSINASSGLVVLGCAEVQNSGTIVAESAKGTSYGVYQEDGRLVNQTGASIKTFCAAGNAIGLYTQKVDVINNGTVTGDYSKLIDSRLAGTGIFVGDLQLQNARLSPGDNGIGRLTVDGDLNCTDGLAMQVEIGAGGFDQVSVSGSATLDGEGALSMVPVGYAAGGNYTIIQATTTLGSGAFTTVTAPALFAGTVSGGDGGFVLALTRHSYADFVQRPELAPLGRALDHVAPHATGSVAAMLNRIDNYADGTAIRAALPQLQPAINASASAAALQGVQRTGAQLAAFSRPYPAGGVSGIGTAWFGALDGRERHGATDGFRAFDENTAGGMAGVDYLLRGHFTVGAAFADVRDRLQERASTDHARLESQRGYLHARWDQRPGTPGWFATARLGLGSSRIETWRRVDFLATEVDGSHRAWDASAALSSGRDFRCRRWTLRPFIDAEYARLTERAYTERGDSGAELAFARRSSDSLLAGVGLAVSTQFDIGRIVLQPEVRARQTREFLPGTDGLLAAFAGGDTFAAPARRFSRDRTELSAALRAKLGEKLAIAVNYTRTDYGQGADYAHVVSGQLQATF